MTKLFRYELRRLLLNKFFIGLLIVACLYSWWHLSSETLLGTADTAPFSSWSYGSFITALLPILLITLLFFIAFFYSKNERAVAVLVDATPTKPSAYLAMQMSTIAVGFMIICTTVIIVSIVFYLNAFRFMGFGNFVLPILITLPPAAILTLGLGMHAGQTHPRLIYVVMAATLFLGHIPLPYSINILSGNFFSIMPMTLRTDPLTEPAFTIPTDVWASRLVITVIGIILVFSALQRQKRLKNRTMAI